MFPALLFLGAILAIGFASKKKLPPGAGEFSIVDGRRHYNPISRQQIFDSFIFRTLFPTSEADTAMLYTGDGAIFGPDQVGAWFMVRALHAEGLNVWSQPNLHLVFDQAPLVFLPRGQAPPAGLVMLLSADTPYPLPPPGLVELFGPPIAA